jgi:hypothetical protein
MPSIRPDIRYPGLAGYPVSGFWISRISGKNSIRCIPTIFIKKILQLLKQTDVRIGTRALSFLLGVHRIPTDFAGYLASLKVGYRIPGEVAPLGGFRALNVGCQAINLNCSFIEK